MINTPHNDLVAQASELAAVSAGADADLFRRCLRFRSPLQRATANQKRPEVRRDPERRNQEVEISRLIGGITDEPTRQHLGQRQLPHEANESFIQLVIHVVGLIKSLIF